MMKGSIQDVQVRIKPSKELVEFLCSLDADESLPLNIARIREANGTLKKQHSNICTDFFPKKILSEKQNEYIRSVATKKEMGKEFCNFSKLIASLDGNDEEDKIEQVGSETKQSSSVKNTVKSQPNQKNSPNKDKQNGENSLLLNINDVRWIDKFLENRRNAGESDVYTHEMLAGSEVVLPENQVIPRNPELEARCVKLREQQQEREYRSMTKDVDATRQHLPEDTIAFQVKSINRQLIAVFQFVVSVISGFAFGFIGLEYIFGDLDFGFRLFMGVMCALIIALAEIYFLAKKLSEYDEPIKDIPMPKRQVRPHQD